eukprot:s2911_g5.t2
MKAAHTEALLLQSVADLPIGSMLRLVLVDIEFHEHESAHDVSTSRRCLALPHHAHRRTLMRILGLELYCERVRSRCLMWCNHSPVKLQVSGGFYLEHGDYLRISVPPWPRASPSVSTRTCVSNMRPSIPSALSRSRSRRPHEDGMTDVDRYESDLYGREDPDGSPDDVSAFLQSSIHSEVFFAPVQPSNMLATELASLCMSNVSLEPVDKIEDEPAERLREARQHDAARDPFAAQLAAHPPFVQDLHHRLVHRRADQLDNHQQPVAVETWFSDHLRRPHSGIGRVVHLEADVATWMTSIIMAWEDWVDPFHTLTCHLVTPDPVGGDPEVLAHIILVQNPRVDFYSALVSISDTVEDLWQPRVMCLMVSSQHLHRDLQHLIDLEQACARGLSGVQCRSWFGDVEVTDEPLVALFHGAALLFSIQHPSAVAPLPDDAVIDADSSSLLQQSMSQRHRVSLAAALPEPSRPVWVNVDCNDVCFLRTQLLQRPPLQPQFEVTDVSWHPATRHALATTTAWRGETPLGFTFHMDGSAPRHRTEATGAVVLIVHTSAGECWGGYVTTEGVGVSTAPRAEASALLLAVRWCLQLVSEVDASQVWVEFSYDCKHIAGIAQGTADAKRNSDLMIPIKALLHWLAPFWATSFTWTHQRGHCGHPWNEAADVLCHHARHQGPCVHDLSLFLHMCTFDQMNYAPVQWLWLLEQSLRAQVNAPLLDGHLWKFNIAQPLSSQPDLKLQPFHCRKDVQPAGPRDLVSMTLQFATANVLTLFPGQDYASGYHGARAESLAHQFLQAGVHFVGLQETRSRLEGHSRLDEYHVISAPATQRGVGGVQLWIQACIAHQDRCLRVDATHLYVLHASAQRLVVRLAVEGLRMILVVLHAPVVDDPAVLDAFWHATSQAIPSRYRSWPLLCWQMRMHGLVLSLLLPLLIIKLMLKMRKARLDYIACPQGLNLDAVVTWIDEHIDLTIHRADHDCVRAPVTMSFLHAAKSARPLSWSSTSTMQWPTWKTDVHTHAAALQCWLRVSQTPTIKWRKQHLREDTMKLIQAKRFHRRRLCQVRNHRRLAVLRLLFDSWRSSEPCVTSHAQWLRQCDHLEAWHSGVFCDLSPRVVAAVRQDDKDFYEGLATMAGWESSRGSHRLWSAIKPLLPKWKAKQRANLRCVGPPIEAKLDHYNNLEAGRIVGYDALVHACHDVQRDAMVDAPLMISLQDLPTRAAIEGILAQVKPNRAPGVDEVRPDTLRSLGPILSEDISKLFLKMWTTGAEPVQWKGGLVHSIGKKARSTCIKDMHGIALLDTLGKVSHAMMRTQLMARLTLTRAPLQLGGFPHQSTLFATHYLRAFTQLAASKHLSSSVLFLDVKSAFHSLIRALVFDSAEPLPPKLQEVLLRQGCDLDQIRQKCASLKPIALPGAASRLLADAHHHTWFTLAGSDVVSQTERGSRPGSPLADAAYNAMMAQLIVEIQQAVDEIPAVRDACASAGVQLPLVAWVDDVAVPVLTLHARELGPVSALVLQKVIQISRSYGLVLNLQPKKTEAVVAFRGAGATQCRRDCYDVQHGHFACPDENALLRCVPVYEHLGTQFVADGTLAAELRSRIARATQAHHQVRKTILGNRHLSCAVRIRLLEGLIVPILMHGAGNWPLLTHRQLVTLQSVYVKWIRSIVGNGCWLPGMVTDQHLLLQWKLPSMPLRLAKLRLLYAFHLVRDCPNIILEVIKAVHLCGRSWFPALRQAVAWMRLMESDLVPFDPAQCPPHMIFDWLLRLGDDGPRHVRRLYVRALHQGHLLGRVVDAHWRLRACFGDFDVGGDAPSNVPTNPGLHECRLCAKTFGSLQPLQTHLWLAHEIVTDERHMMTSTTCAACHMCFWTSQRLQQHLRYSRRHRGGCYEQLTWRLAPQVCAPDVGEERSRIHFHRRPAARVATAPSLDELQLTTRDQALHAWQQCWVSEGLPSDQDLTFAQSLFGALDQALCQWHPDEPSAVDDFVYQLMTLVDEMAQTFVHTVYGEWAFVVWILDYMRYSRFRTVSMMIFQRLDCALQTFLIESRVGQLLRWKRRMDDAYQPHVLADDDGERPLVSFPLEPILDICTSQHELLSAIFQVPLVYPPSTKVPVGMDNGKPILWILHLFSGRRRVGDCHWWLASLGARLLPAFCIRLISVDTAIDAVHGDLSTGANLAMVLAMARRGLFAAVLTGPPCETFSAARGILLENHRGPRPLRSVAQPWCIPERSLREMRQCDMGSELLLNSLQVETTVVCAGGGALMEHPAPPNDEEKVSVWRWRCHTQWCMALREAHQHRIDQWLFGSVGVKPTTLRALNLGPAPVVGRVLHEGAEAWRTRPMQGLKGRRSDGAYRTAGAKEYPSALCRSLIVAVLSGLKYRIHREGLREPVEPAANEQAWLQLMMERSEVLALASYLPDYQGA